MSITIARNIGRRRGERCAAPDQGFLPEPAPRVGAHAYADKRVRDDVREAVLVMAFSVSSAVGISLFLTAAVHLLG